MENNENEFVLVTGCMFAGKSKFLIENFHNNPNVEAFSPSIDTRDTNIKSRAYPEKNIPCTKVSTLKEINPTKKTVLIDEFQFFSPEDLKDFVTKCKEQNRRLVMAGLDLLANKKEWASYTAVKDLCDKEIKLKAKCSKCGKPASFTSLINGKKDISIQIEGEDVRYEPRCRSHYE